MALELKEGYFAFTPEYKKQIEPLEVDEKHIDVFLINNECEGWINGILSVESRG